MNRFKDISNFYFIGIGGIGMSALARYFILQGKAVAGYDKTPSAITKELQQEGAAIIFTEDIALIPSHFKSPKNTCVIYTPAIPKDSTLLSYFKKEGFTLNKRAEILGQLSKDTTCLAVAGTHGKTTTASILAHLLVASGAKITAFLGGISENYQSNFIYTGTDLMVVEADEFDRSFLQLHPDIGCITSIDADHLDIYKDSKQFENTFEAFAKLLPEANKLLHKKGLPFNGQTVSVTEPADFQALHTRIENGHYVFDLKTPTNTLKNLRFALPGQHNLFNAVTALGMAITAGSPTHSLSKALYEFKGVKRRFSYKIKKEDCILIDDYAHHPTELNALYQAVSEMYPKDEKLIVFQPHLFSRTRDFESDFAKSLAQFDQVFLLDIYPAREKPIPGVTSQSLIEKIRVLTDKTPKTVQLITKEALPEMLKKNTCKIKLLVGAGDIGEEVEKITKILTHEN